MLCLFSSAESCMSMSLCLSILSLSVSGMSSSMDVCVSMFIEWLSEWDDRMPVDRVVTDVHVIEWWSVSVSGMPLSLDMWVSMFIEWLSEWDERMPVDSKVADVHVYEWLGCLFFLSHFFRLRRVHLGYGRSIGERGNLWPRGKANNDDVLEETRAGIEGYPADRNTVT